MITPPLAVPSGYFPSSTVTRKVQVVSVAPTFSVNVVVARLAVPKVPSAPQSGEVQA